MDALDSWLSDNEEDHGGQPAPQSRVRDVGGYACITQGSPVYKNVLGG